LGAGTLVLNGNPTFNANSSLLVSGGTLRFNVVSGVAAIGTGVTATIASGATLELAGSVSALSSGSNRVNVLNNSTAPGIFVSGTNQQVGNIDGSGTTQVNAGSDLTANHIIQSALVIGGTAGSHGLVVIDASDASGNPLGQSDVIPTRLVAVSALDPSSATSFSSGGSNFGTLVALGVQSSTGDLIPAGGGTPTSGPASVPEPSTLLLVCLALVTLVSQARQSTKISKSARRRTQ
jgi:hypothetical protein